MEPINEQLKAIFNAGLDAVKTDSAVKKWVKRQGESREAARVLAAIAMEVRQSHHPIAPPGLSDNRR